MIKILFLNGPPGCGKDTAAQLLAPLGWKRYAFADELKDHFERAFGYTQRPEGPEKELPMPPPFQKLTYRQGVIVFSENYMKPLFGEDIFGRILRNKILAERPEKVIITDSGFSEEALPILKEFGIHNCRLVHLSRPGASFDYDSRSYWRKYGLSAGKLENNSTIEAFKSSLYSYIYVSGLEEEPKLL